MYSYGVCIAPFGVNCKETIANVAIDPAIVWNMVTLLWLMARISVQAGFGWPSIRDRD